MGKSPWKWFIGFLVIPGGVVVCGILGLIVGAYIGGNYAQDFTFNGGRGYEAAGPLGLIVGAITGGVLGLRLVLTYSIRAEKEREQCAAVNNFEEN